MGRSDPIVVSPFLCPPPGCTLTDDERVVGLWVVILPVVVGPPKLSRGSDPEGKWVRWALPHCSCLPAARDFRYNHPAQQEVVRDFQDLFCWYMSSRCGIPYSQARMEAVLKALFPAVRDAQLAYHAACEDDDESD